MEFPMNQMAVATKIAVDISEEFRGTALLKYILDFFPQNISTYFMDRLTYRKYFIVSQAYSNFFTFILRVYFQTGLLSRERTLT